MSRASRSLIARARAPAFARLTRGLPSRGVAARALRALALRRSTAAIANLSLSDALHGRLKKMGCYFALDDFGSGLSSFTYLKNLPVDYLKIDGSFIRDVVDDPHDRAMVEAISRVGHAMGLKTVAEYVESEAILQLLRHIGIDYAQGHAIEVARPLIANPEKITVERVSGVKSPVHQ